MGDRLAANHPGPNRARRLDAWNSDGVRPARFIGVAGAQGKVSVTTTSATPAHDLQHGDGLTLDCRLGSGDEVSLAATVF